jgi:HTH-type transcriptional regulator/antitoxin HigA
MKKTVNYTHVGEILLDELVARNLSQMWLVRESKIHKTIITDIINGKRSVNAMYAIKLENALQIDAEFWLNAQSNYDLAKIRNRLKRHAKIKKRKMG